MADRLSFEKDGFAILPNSLSPPQIGMLIDCVSHLGGFGVRSRSGVYAVRNLLDVSCEVRLLASSPAIMKIVGQFFAADAFPVRGILFDKVHGANWLVPWHQDLTIAVRERIDTPGYGPWSAKGHRRVIHIDYASLPLHGDLQWHRVKE